MQIIQLGAMRTILFCVIFGFLGNALLGQTDSIVVETVDVLLTDSLETDSLLIDSLESDSLLIDSLDSLLTDSLLTDSMELPEPDSLLQGLQDSTDLIQEDSAFVASPSGDSAISDLKDLARSPKKKFRIQDYKPLFIKTEEKATLRLSFPWRESVTVPIPKGFLPSPWTDVPDPDVAWQRALMFPGLGQVYNRSSWKVPIFYLGYAAVGGWMAFTQSQYSLYQTAFFCFENGCTIPAQAIGDGQGLRTQRESWRQRRDQAILIIIAWHGISAVESYVDAHLKDFDVSEDLGFKMAPAVISGPAPAFGLGLNFSLGKLKK